MDINGSVVVITGGGQGLGRAMALSIAAKGGKLALIDLNQEALDESVKLCEEAGGEARTYIANVTREDEVIATMDAIVADFGTVDALINNAGITRDGLLIKAKDGEVQRKMTLDAWQAVIDVNLTGVFLCGREFAERLITLGKGGVIINISSLSLAGNMGQTNYTATKAGVAAMTVVWAKELARYGIRCAGIAPGYTATDMVMSMKPEALEMMASQIPLKRLGEPAEMGHSAVFILENDYYNGRIIETDGGIRI